MIRGVLEWNPHTLAETKRMASEIEAIHEGYDKLRMKEDDAIP